ncbi:hypothetical protein ABBQ32_004785 [Trebouxia sp. C0010 RCD-2024]
MYNEPANGCADTYQHSPQAAPQTISSASLSKRRAAKRESARRVRAKNKDLLSSLRQEASELEGSNSSLTDDIAVADAGLCKLREQLAGCRAQTVYTRTLTEQLSEELSMLQRMGAGLRHQRELFTSTLGLEPAETSGR